MIQGTIQEDRFADRVNAHTATHLAVYPLPSLTVEKTREQSLRSHPEVQDLEQDRIS